eukprot:MONOS_4776.1-p1 / transcript=MONOS_4776.1 / gene=MONOS_4776 / organism=Monocercomonoides_exilis_PA203 / gene_product=unspecified product / transcript_product=unspecified product / location=Mono_scaffold00131:108675-109358(-) / protein_length=228 / sequence_SO=supercontig / SO=protein_coding / is_pseudo=false
MDNEFQTSDNHIQLKKEIELITKDDNDSISSIEDSQESQGYKDKKTFEYMPMDDSQYITKKNSDVKMHNDQIKEQSKVEGIDDIDREKRASTIEQNEELSIKKSIESKVDKECEEDEMNEKLDEKENEKESKNNEVAVAEKEEIGEIQTQTEDFPKKAEEKAEEKVEEKEEEKEEEKNSNSLENEQAHILNENDGMKITSQLLLTTISALEEEREDSNRKNAAGEEC